MEKQTSRRRTLAALGGLASATVLAGCTSADDTEDPDDTEDDDIEEEEEEQDGEEEEEQDEEEEEEQDEEEEEEEEEEEPTQELDPEQWEDIESIRVLSDGTDWTGADPEMIDGIQNPTLILFEGQEYELTYENADGGPHNIEIRDDGGSIVDELETDVVTQGEETLEFTATEEMNTYVCAPHQSSMVGDLQIE